MGGDLKVKSELGKRTTFSFDVPMKLPEAAESESIRATRIVTGLVTGQPEYRLLVVEDNENNRALLVQLLRTVGFEVQEAVHGRDALAVWRKWKPHLIWMDMRMPVMDGYQATRRIREMEKNLEAERPKLKGESSKQITEIR